LTKDELLNALETGHNNMLELVAQCQPEQIAQPGVTGEWSIKDILAHISAWEAELVKLLWQVRQSQEPSSIHFSGGNVDEINQRWQASLYSRPLGLVLSDFNAVRKQTVRRVKDFSDEELTTPGYFPGLKAVPLWEWIANDSFDHESEHAESIQEWLNNQLA